MTSYGVFREAVAELRIVGDAILGVLLAPRCLACDAALERPLSGPVCAACWAAIAFLTPPLCDACGAPLPSWRTVSHAAIRCPRCRRHPGTVDRAATVGPYDGSLRTLVHALKYDGRRSLAPPLARLMADAGRHLVEGSDYVIPVPLHVTRRRARGFNQAADLAANLGRNVIPALRRVRRTIPQTGLSAGRRRRNMRNAFAMARGHEARIRSRTVLLVDDVVTTGATLEACARVLKASGAREVRALTVARAVAQRL